MNGERVYDSRAVANYLIEKARDSGGLDPLQIMKLVYLCHGFTLALLDRPLLKDDIEAWRYGPVIRRIYSHIPYGRVKVTSPISNYHAEFTGQERSILDQVYEKYGHLSGISLSRLTHQPGTPWQETWDRHGQNTVIPQDLIQEHFEELVERGRQNRA